DDLVSTLPCDATPQKQHSFPTRRSSDLLEPAALAGVPGIARVHGDRDGYLARAGLDSRAMAQATHLVWATGGSMVPADEMQAYLDRKSTRLNSSHVKISYAVFCLKKKKK